MPPKTRRLSYSCDIASQTVFDQAHSDLLLINLLPSQTWLNQLTLSPQLREYIQKPFWPDVKSSADLSEYKSYFAYFEKTMSTMAFSEISSNPQTFAMRTYGDMKKVVERLRLDRSESRKTTTANLEAIFPGSSDSQRQRSVELTARLWLMIHMESSVGPIVPQTPLIWQDDISLREAFKLWFPKCRPPSRENTHRVARELTVVNLRKLHGVDVWWTPNLKDHLEYHHETRTLRVFSHKVCLQSHLKVEEQEIKQQEVTQQDSGQQEINSIFPVRLLDETIRTLDILFPFGDDRTMAYLEDQGQNFYGLTTPRHSRYMSADLNDFDYWRDRLAVLYDLLDQPPSTLVGMLYDRRNPIQWWTFWLAVFFSTLIFVFGVAGLILGFKQLSLSQKAHALAVSQACVQPVKPPGLC